MKKSIIRLILLSLYLNISCTSDHVSEKEEMTSIEYYFKGTKIVRSRFEVKNKKFNGTGIEFFKNGKVKSTGNYVTNQKDGEHYTYFETGKIHTHGWFKEGLKTGLHQEFDSKGTLIVEANYEDDRKNGIFKNYYENGNLHMHFNFKDNYFHGEQKTYYLDNKIRSISNYQDGHMGVGLKEYDEKGKLLDQKVEILIEQNDRTKLDGSYLLSMTLTNNKKARFYIEDDFNNDFLLTNKVFEVPLKNGQYRHKFHLGEHNFLLMKLAVFAKTSSVLGNELVLKKIVNIATDN